MRYEEQSEKISVESEEYDLIHDMLLFASCNPDFDPAFLDSVNQNGERRGFISAAQYNSLRMVYESFRMHEPKRID